MNADVEIVIKEYDKDNLFLTIKREQYNLFNELGICQFVDEMEYWDLPIKEARFHEENGYIFSKDIDEEYVIMETKRFINHNNL